MKIDKVIALLERKTELLKELKQSMIYEKCIYHLVKHGIGRLAQYSLIDIHTKENLSHGFLPRVERYIRSRNINEKLIYKD